jgi:hypothetical protein
LTTRLEEAVEAFRAALKEWTRELTPIQWAATQNNLGNALVALGAREPGTARLGEAVAAYQATLGVYTRGRLPLDSEQEEHNVGIALATLDEDPEVRPAAHTFVAYKAPWYEITDDLPQYQEGRAAPA